MKPWQLALIAFGIVVLICCGAGSYLAYNVFQKAKNADADADHYADAALRGIAANWDYQDLQRYESDEWKRGQSEAGTKQFLSMMKSGLGSLKTAEPFSATYTGAQVLNGETVTLVSLKTTATFAKNKGVVLMQLIKHGDQWKVLGLKVNSHAFDNVGNFKPTSSPLRVAAESPT